MELLTHISGLTNSRKIRQSVPGGCSISRLGKEIRILLLADPAVWLGVEWGNLAW